MQLDHVDQQVEVRSILIYRPLTTDDASDRYLLCLQSYKMGIVEKVSDVMFTLTGHRLNVLPKIKEIEGKSFLYPTANNSERGDP